LIANISPEGHRGESLGYFILAFTLSGALAPPLAMLLINRLGFTALFLACLGLSLCSLILACTLRNRTVSPVQPPPPSDGFLLSRRALQPSIMGFFPFFIWGALTTFFPIYAIRQGVSNPGLFFSTVAVVLILGRVLGGKILDLYSRERIIMPSIAPFIISMVILAFSKTLPMFILVGIIYGFGPAFLIPALMAYALDRGASPGPAMATFNTVSDLGLSLGPVMMGMVLHSASYPVMFLGLAFTGMMGLVYFRFFMQKDNGSS
jgi:MFS family permease